MKDRRLCSYSCSGGSRAITSKRVASEKSAKQAKLDARNNPRLVSHLMTSTQHAAVQISSTSTAGIRSCPVPESQVESGKLPLRLDGAHIQHVPYLPDAGLGNAHIYVLPNCGNAFHIFIVLLDL